MSESEVTRELIITSHPHEVQIALLEDKRLVEIHREKSSDQFSVGDIYLGKVKKINPGLNAAFISVGSEKDAFLHYLDLGAHVQTLNEFVKQAIEKNKQSIANFAYQPEIEKNGKIGSVLSSGQQLLVQIAKEPISTKGPRVSTEISFAGRYLVLVPFMDKVTVSQKIKSAQERKRLKKIVQGIKPKNFGIIIRTVAENKQVDDISEDLRQLVERWKVAVSKLHRAVPPTKIAADLDKTSALIRDLVNESFNAIYVDSLSLYNEIKTYLKSISFDKTKILHQYKEKQPIFEHFNVALQIKSSFGKIVTVKNGVYLIIEHTEAMHVIDVNSGKRVKSNLSQEENAMEVNLIAAAEIARQLRLRDMGGIITIDFIDLAQSANRTQLLNSMKEFMAPDKARHTILPVNKFGIMQITRQRVRQATIIETAELCPSCQGTGKVKASILLEEEVDNTIDFLIKKQHESKITIVLHPYLYAYFTKGLFSKKMKWYLKYKQWIKVKSNSDYNILEYRFLNSENEEIVLWKTPHVTN
ncbi:Rne/Rng family ribonuclease [Bacteroidales bacterium OttesenSCG-928-B11]|nr:Rne/Rng family ribonuclease [Bacteroidales bacterium OttesenSCG-928-B11]MDL2325983.1 Rne/Rng family ribonuclease [Bacteroidales bacterium OttesenSCG-928-A14]